MPTSLRMRPLAAAIALAGTLLLPAAARADRLSDAERAIAADDARATIGVLAGPEMQGRRVGTDGNHKAGDWIVAKLVALGIDARFEPFEVDGVAGRNIVAKIPAKRGALSSEWIAIGA